VPVQDIWLEFRDAHNQNIRVTGYPTEKNPALLARLIAASSNPGDLVLDCFSGSGTTLEAAQRLGRRWLGVDNSAEAIGTTLARFAKGAEPMGDFVRRPRDKDTTVAETETLSLPGLENLTDSESQQTRPHAVITDFVLYVEEGLQAEKVLRDWPPTGSAMVSKPQRVPDRHEAASCREQVPQTATGLPKRMPIMDAPLSAVPAS
jgi:adenine-specific DNA-methyltransferase